MRQVVVTGPGQFEVLDVEPPEVGGNDVVIRPRACGICGSDGYYIQAGGVPPREGATPLGHEVAGEVVEIGTEVEGLAVGDHVVVNPMGEPRGIIGNGGPTGGLADLLHLRDAVVGRSVRVVPVELPWTVAALNEPMAVALHGVERAQPKPGDRVVVFGAGPIGLGAAIAFRSRGAGHVVVVDVRPSRLAKALEIGADAVIDSSTEDVGARLLELHGAATDGVGRPKVGTDVYLDAAGVPQVIATALEHAKHRAMISVVAVHKAPVAVDLAAVLASEITLVTSMGYPTEIFEVTDVLIQNAETYEKLISHTFDFADVEEALAVAMAPGRADKVVVTFS